MVINTKLKVCINSSINKLKTVRGSRDKGSLEARANGCSRIIVRINATNKPVIKSRWSFFERLNSFYFGGYMRLIA